MAVNVEERGEGRVLVVRVTGKLVKEDYDRFVPEVDRLVEKHGKVNMLLEMIDFHGWTVAAMWEDCKFGLKHFRDIERLAVVGEKRWQKGLAAFCKPFTTARIRYFDRARAAEALEWVQGEPAKV